MTLWPLDRDGHGLVQHGSSRFNHVCSRLRIWRGHSHLAQVASSAAARIFSHPARLARFAPAPPVLCCTDACYRRMHGRSRRSRLGLLCRRSACGTASHRTPGPRLRATRAVPAWLTVSRGPLRVAAHGTLWWTDWAKSRVVKPLDPATLRVRWVSRDRIYYYAWVTAASGLAVQQIFAWSLH
jgi:hypothetical protein